MGKMIMRLPLGHLLTKVFNGSVWIYNSFVKAYFVSLILFLWLFFFFFFLKIRDKKNQGSIAIILYKRLLNISLGTILVVLECIF